MQGFVVAQASVVVVVLVVVPLKKAEMLLLLLQHWRWYVFFSLSLRVWFCFLCLLGFFQFSSPCKCFDPCCDIKTVSFFVAFWRSKTANGKKLRRQTFITLSMCITTTTDGIWRSQWWSNEWMNGSCIHDEGHGCSDCKSLEPIVHCSYQMHQTFALLRRAGWTEVLLGFTA